MLASSSHRSAQPTLAPGPTAAPGNVSASRQLGLTCASHTSLRLKTKNNVSKKRNSPTERPLRLPMQGPFFRRGPLGTTRRINSDFVLVRPQALPKFNPRKQAVGSFPNGLFTGHSREKQEPPAHGRCCH
jgi:hypothetical protein